MGRELTCSIMQKQKDCLMYLMENCGLITLLSKMIQVPLFHCTTPSANCPYRIDAPVEHWHIDEFKKVLAAENSTLGSLFMCHKQNGSACIGWLMDQDKRDHPSIALRIKMIKENVTREYLDKLHCDAPLYMKVLKK